MFSNQYKITCKKEYYYKSGSRWILEPEKTETFELEQETLNKLCSKDTLKYYRRMGGFERLEYNYFSAGYLPYILNSINPDRTEKHKRTFSYSD